MRRLLQLRRLRRLRRRLRPLQRLPPSVQPLSVVVSFVRLLLPLRLPRQLATRCSNPRVHRLLDLLISSNAMKRRRTQVRLVR
jgi:hypothetical protein